MFNRHVPIGSKLVRDINEKGITLRPYFSKYINLRHVFIQIFKNNKQLLNLKKLEKKLRHKSIEEVLYHLEDMIDSLNMKFKKRFINDLDLVDNMVRICDKLIEKGFKFTNKHLFNTYHDAKATGKNSEEKNEFEVI
eukprot:TRINITY_DN14938_c0_g1_i1.p1 TRINITY_DN14938_c0_g1~~TRINITY_DN14938_c0_g1_i1.p1  ORF type:complete len:137 (+),score=43.68 TRINITY_DN14938_c0_g1_i1:850-1260(+)